jgi:hypothetical protein
MHRPARWRPATEHVQRLKPGLSDFASNRYGADRGRQSGADALGRAVYEWYHLARQ